MSALIDSTTAVLDGWRPRLIDAIRVALRGALPWVSVNDSDVCDLLGCSRMAFDRPDPAPGTLSAWLENARRQGVALRVESVQTPNGTSWRASAQIGLRAAG